MRYVVSTVMMSDVRKGKKQAAPQLIAELSKVFEGSGWHLDSTSGASRSDTKDGIEVDLLPSEINDDSVNFRVQSKCAKMGEFAAELRESYRSGRDAYRGSGASSSRVPTGFPDMDSHG
ncbi:hypothetical protein [Streptomyces sp. NBC_00388]|uniref:hypothetical protein n=1 Tax=Streptomyces sp. NBC_00388 TaxID=2975735 RepID=UPI002E23370C